MARASIRVDLQNQGASLRTIARELRAMDEQKVTGIFRDRIEPVARRYVPAVRASVMAIPTTGTKHTGLRARIAACAETATWGTGREVNVAVEMNPQRMPSGEMALPLYMEGATGARRSYTRWRHPVYGKWLAGERNQPSHPYFYQAVSGFGLAAGAALRSALEDITRDING